MTAQPEQAEIPLLEGYKSVSEAADWLGVSRQAVHKMVHTGRMTTARRVPGSRNEHIIIGEEEVIEMAKARLEQVVDAPSDEGSGQIAGAA